MTEVCRFQTFHFLLPILSFNDISPYKIVRLRLVFKRCNTISHKIKSTPIQWCSSICDYRYINVVFLFQIELATGKFPYTSWKTPFEQLKQVVHDDPPRLPPGTFSRDFEKFMESWWVRVAVIVSRVLAIADLYCSALVSCRHHNIIEQASV
jgi:hypothetical protein